jgi:myo-inositol-1(or 4)-monophosphatase
MHAIVNIAIRAVRKVGAYVMTERDRLQHQFDATRLAQLQEQVMQMMAEIILGANQNHGVVGFNYASEENAASDIVWQIEIVSGAENLLRGIPHFAIVVVISEKKKVKHTVVFDPHTDEIFSATVGGGAKCNSTRLRMNSQTSLAGLIINDTRLQKGFVSSYGDNVNLYQQGCPALAMAYLAADRFNGFVGTSLSKIELLAGTLLIQEAGGLVSDFSGGYDYVSKGELIAAHPKLFKLLAQAVKVKE